MIDQLAALGKVNSIGRDGFIWWIGQIAHKDSWRAPNKLITRQGWKSNRVKVRIVGYHPFDPEGNDLPDEDLPWAEVMADPFTGNGQGELNETLNLNGGEMVLGFFLDGEDAQQPVVMGLFPKYNNVKNTFKASEMKGRKSSGFQSFQAYTKANLNQPEGPSSTGLANNKPIVSPEVSNNNDGTLKGGGSDGQRDGETKATKTITNDSPCNDTAIGGVMKVVTDFLEMVQGVQGFETGLNSWADPLLNEIIDMQSELEFVKNQVSGFMRSSMNEMKMGLMKAINKKFKKLLSDLMKTDPKGVLKSKKVKKSLGTITDLLNCAFNAALGKIGGFIVNMFKKLLGNALNGAICAVEEFTAGIFAKMFDVLESSLGTIMSGLNWLVGGLSSVTGALRSVSGLANKILGYIKGCNIESCGKVTEYASNFGAKIKAPDKYPELLGKINVLSGISDSLNNAGRGGGVRAGINSFFGLTDEDQAIDGLSIFNETDMLFPDCARNNNNPISQGDITPSRPGFIYPKCLPPDYEVVGSGSGAELLIVVGNSRRIFSVEVINGGSGYDLDTHVTIIDNTGNGTGANVKPIVKDGSIVEVVILSAGFGYCLDTKSTVSGIGTNVIGTVLDVYVSKPGIGYDPNDIITFEGVDDGTNLPIITTPNGSIVGVRVPSIIPTEFSTPPVLVVNSENGIGAEFIPVMTFKGQFKTDVGADERRARSLSGINQVIDCIGDKTELVGYVNGVPYYGPFHLHPKRGVKMVGAQHVDYPHEIIYDTMEESLGQPSVVSQVSRSTTSETTETSETTTPVDPTPTIVTEQVTPTTTPTETTTDTSTSSGSSDSTPPSTPPSSPPSSGGYGGY